MHQQKVQRLDVIRGIAILSVLVVHSTWTAAAYLTETQVLNDTQHVIYEIGSWGRYGVELFFLLSGFLLATIDVRNEKFRPKFYFYKRLARVYPLWIAFLAFYLLVFFVFPQFQTGFSFAQGIYDETGNPLYSTPFVAISAGVFLLWFTSPLVFGEIIPGGWSIQAEVAHYAIFPSLRKLGISGLVTAVAICGFAYWGIELALQAKFEGVIGAMFTGLKTLTIATTLPFFLLGMILARLPKEKVSTRNWKFAVNHPKKVLNILVVLSGGILLLNAQVHGGSFFYALLFVSLFWLTSKYIAKSKLLSKPLSHVGKYSYFTYYFHFLMLFVATFLISRFKSLPIYSAVITSTWSYLVLIAVVFAIALGGSLLVAPLSYRYFERPFIARAAKSMTS